MNRLNVQWLQAQQSSQSTRLFHWLDPAATPKTPYLNAVLGNVLLAGKLEDLEDLGSDIL